MEKLISVNELSLNFNLREPKGNKSTNVYAVVKCGSVQLKFAIGCKCNSWQWNKKQQTPIISQQMTDEERVNNTKVLSVISAIRFGYLNYFSYICKSQQMTSEKEIKETINNIINEINCEDMANNENLRKSVVRTPKATTLLMKAFEIYYTEIKTVKESAKNAAFSLLKSFFKYCEVTGNDKLSMLSQRGLNDYKAYLIEKSKEDCKNGCARYDGNTQINNKCQAVAKYINQVLSVHNDFLRYHIIKVSYQNLEEVNPKNEDKKRRPLTDEEINKLITCATLTDEEKEYRDLFLLECYCAYRVGDTPKLFDKNLQRHYEKDGFELIMINTQKEHIDAIIWLTDEVKEILNKYENGFQYANPTERTYSQKLNYRLKTVAKKAGLDAVETYTDTHNKKITRPLYEILSSHFARYTFIYNGLTKLGLQPNQLKNFTGHADDTMINECYAVISKDDKFNSAVKALERVSKANSTNEDSKGSESDKVREYRDVLAFYREPYINYRHINDSEELLRLIISKYEMPLRERGYSTQLCKKIYNNNDLENREEYEKLLQTLNEISDKLEK
jgi:integrase